MRSIEQKNFKELIRDLPFYIMVFFSVIHLGVLVQLDIGGKNVNLGFVNQLVSLLYAVAVYLWALFDNKKRWITMTAVGMATLTVICAIVSVKNFGPSANDLLCTGTAILSLLYVFENAQYLLKLVKKNDKLITAGIWLFVGISALLFTCFRVQIDQWGEGTYLFGHRYASVCGSIMIVITLKLLNRPKHAWMYWILLLTAYVLCFITGARVYVLSGLGTLCAVTYTFSKGWKEFILKCMGLTLATIFLFFGSSIAQKTANTVRNIDFFGSSMSAANEEGEEITSADSSANRKILYMSVANAVSNGRPYMWNNCWQSYKTLPAVNKLVGSGNRYIYDHNDGLHAHMDFLNILHYHGLLGLAVYVLVFIGYIVIYWKKWDLPVILLIGIWGIWLVLSFLNGYMSYTANMMTIPYIAVMASDKKKRENIQS